jgi:hypothetical protein
MRLPKLAALVIALVSATLLSNSAVALSQDVGGISCDVISDYGATSPAYFEVFQAFLEGYLAGQKKLGPDSRDAATLMSQIIDFCKVSRDATLASAVAAVAK